MSSDSEATQTRTVTAYAQGEEGRSSRSGGRRLGLVLAWSPAGLDTADRLEIGREVNIGRSSSCDWCVPDNLLSRKHFALQNRGERALLFDLGSKNGTTLDGRQLEAHMPSMVEPGAVVRAGNCLFVVVDDLRRVPTADEMPSGPMAGRFHTAALLHELEIAARTGKHILLDGESGSGKELAAERLHELYTELGRVDVFRAHNAAHHATGGDAKGDLFGITKGAFTDVTPRAGLLEEAAGGTVFLDEIHSYPLEVQRSLLRFVEDGLLHRLGEPGAGRKVDVRLVLATNLSVDQACSDGTLAHDLVARLHRVTLPPVRARRADIPSILHRILQKQMGPAPTEDIFRQLDVVTVEKLCLHDYRRGNIRELADIAAVVGARIAVGEDPIEAFDEALETLLAQTAEEPASSEVQSTAETANTYYERHKDEIIAAYHEVDGKLVQLEATLKERGLSCTRRWLSEYLERWGIRAKRKRRK